MPIKIQDATVWRRLQVKFAIVGRHILLLDEVVVPVIVVDSLIDDVDATPYDATWFINTNSGVGDDAASILENSSVGSNFLIDRVEMCVLPAANMLIQLSPTPPVSALAGTANKSWNNILQTPVVPGTMFSDDGVFAGNILWRGRLNTSTPYMVKTKVVLEPGEQLVVQTRDASIETWVSFQGRVVPR